MTCARDSGDFWEKKGQVASRREKKVNAGWTCVSFSHWQRRHEERKSGLHWRENSECWMDTCSGNSRQFKYSIDIDIDGQSITLPFMKNWNILQLFVKLCTSKSGFILPMWHLDDDFFPSILLWSKLFYLSLICFGLYWITKGYKWVFTL